MIKNKIILICIILIITSLISLTAGELIYQPVNPSFGGNPYNGSWLLNQAQAQDDTGEDAKKSSAYKRKDPQTQFQESLNRLILSRLSSKIIDAMTEDGEIKPGTFEIGNYSVVIEEQGTMMNITLNDMATGNQTVIEVPAL